MDEKLKPVSDSIFKSIGIPDGHKFLDIGSGAGSTTMRLKALVGSTASVTGIDISEPMVAFAREKSKAIDNVDFVDLTAIIKRSWILEFSNNLINANGYSACMVEITKGRQDLFQILLLSRYQYVSDKAYLHDRS